APSKTSADAGVFSISERKRDETDSRDLRHDPPGRDPGHGGVPHRGGEAASGASPGRAGRALHRGRVARGQPQGRRLLRTRPERAPSRTGVTGGIRLDTTTQGRVDDDAQLQALLAADTDFVCIVGKSWDRHVIKALHTSLEDGVAMVAESIEFLRERGKRVFF